MLPPAAGERPADAETHYRGALTLASQLGMRCLVARYRLDLGVLHDRAGHVAQACEHLTSAADMLRMQRWLSRAEEALRALASA